MTIAELHERGDFAPIREVATTGTGPQVDSIGGQHEGAS
jgi:hypothetical protein